MNNTNQENISADFNQYHKLNNIETKWDNGVNENIYDKLNTNNIANIGDVKYNPKQVEYICYNEGHAVKPRFEKLLEFNKHLAKYLLIYHTMLWYTLQLFTGL